MKIKRGSIIIIAIVSIVLVLYSFSKLSTSSTTTSPSTAAMSSTTATSSVADTIQKLISSNIVFVASKSYCPYCTKAKNVFKHYKLKGYKVLELDQELDDATSNSYQDEFQRITKGRSVPRVFIGGKFIGGGDDTVALHSSGKLKELLAAAGALDEWITPTDEDDDDDGNATIAAAGVADTAVIVEEDVDAHRLQMIAKL